MNAHEISERHRRNVATARELANRHGKPFTIWQDRDNEHIRCGFPADDAEANRNQWFWLTLVTPNNGTSEFQS